MSVNFIEGKHPGGYLISEANLNRARDNVILITGQNLSAGTVLGVITASGKYTQHAPGASDGSQVAAAILFANVDATAADTMCVVHSRDCEVNTNELVFANAISSPNKIAAIAALKALGIVVRA